MSRSDSLKWLKALVYIGIYGGLLIPPMFIPVVIFPFVFSKLAFYQVLIGLTFPAYLALAWAEPQYRPRWRPMYIAIASYFVAVLLSVIFAVDPLRAWWGNQERMNGLFTVLHFFAWLTMAASVLRTWEQWRKLLLYEIAISVFMGVVALLQIPFPRILLFPAGARVGGLVDNPIYLAGYQIFNLFFIALIWLKDASKSLRIWFAIAALIDIGSFIATQSRGGLLGLAVGMVVFAVVYGLLTTNKRMKTGVLGLTLVAFLSYGMIFALRQTEFIQKSPLARLVNFQVTTETRFIAWQIAWQGFLERPLTGWGYDNFHILFNQKYMAKSLEFGYYETWFDRAHNTVMDTLAMTGIFGFITYFSIFGTLFYAVFRAYRKGWIDVPTASVFIALPIGYFVQNLFVFDQPAGFTMSFLMYAMILSLTDGERFQEKKEGAKEPVVRSVPWTAFGVVQFLALVLVYRMTVLPFKASYYTIQSNNYFSAGLLPVAFDYAKKAAAIPTPYLDEQTFLQGRNLMTLAENNQVDKFPQWKEWYGLVKQLTDDHLKDHGASTHPHFIYARYLQDFARLVPEDAAASEREYKEAIKTSPKRQQLFYSLARLYVEHGRKEEANELFRQAVEFDPNVGESHWYYGVSLMYDLGKKEEGAKEIQAAFTASSPYQLKEVREATAVAIADVLLNDKEGFRKMMQALPTLPGGTAALYLDIARAAEGLGLTQERNLILGAIAQAEPSIAARLLPLQNGSATSINDSLKMTEGITTTSTSPTKGTTTSSATGGTGPRR